MLITDKISDNGDPSTDIQKFENLKLKVYCSRYWWFEIWKGHRMSFPYWRLYWNKNEGAYIYLKERINLLPDHIYLIAPHTPYSTGIVNQNHPLQNEYFFKCGRINSKKEERRHRNNGRILHYFTHFTLGINYDSVKPGIFSIALNKRKKENLDKVLDCLLSDSTVFHLEESLYLYNLIMSSMLDILPDISIEKRMTPKISSIIDYIEKNMSKKLTSEVLGKTFLLSPNALFKIFKTYTGKSPKGYISQVRIEKASDLLLYTDFTIDVIADKCGFSDRHHLTKAFSKAKQISPAMFRRNVGYF